MGNTPHVRNKQIFPYVLCHLMQHRSMQQLLYMDEVQRYGVKLNVYIPSLPL